MKPLKKPPVETLPFHLQDALDKIQFPKSRIRIRWQVVLAIILVHAILLFLLQDEMMVRARKMFRPEIVYATIIPPAVTPPASTQNKVKPSEKTTSATTPIVPIAPTAPNTSASSKAIVPSSEVAR